MAAGAPASVEPASAQTASDASDGPGPSSLPTVLVSGWRPQAAREPAKESRATAERTVLPDTFCSANDIGCQRTGALYRLSTRCSRTGLMSAEATVAKSATV